MEIYTLDFILYITESTSWRILKGVFGVKWDQIHYHFFDDFYSNVETWFFSKSSLEKFTDPIRVRLISNFGVQNVYNTITKRTEVVSLLNFPDFVF